MLRQESVDRRATSLLALHIGSPLLFGIGAVIARTGVRVETRALLLGFAAFCALELPGLLQRIARKLSTGRKAHTLLSAASTFCLVSIAIMAAVVVPRQPLDPITQSRILFLGVANLALAAALTVSNRTAQAILKIRHERAETAQRLAELAERVQRKKPGE